MNNRLAQFAIVAVIAGIIGAGLGFLGGNALFAGDGEASEEVTAPTLDPNGPTATPGYSQVVATNEALSTEVADAQAMIAEMEAQGQSMAEAVEPTTVPATEVPPTEVPATEEPASEAAASDDAAEERLLFRIQQDESEVRFNIDETLNGERITVVGTTDQVAGDIIVDFGNPGSSQLGTIRINVRTLATDNNFRNQAIRGRILESGRDEFEFAEFVPTDVAGLPESVAVGDTIAFQVTGDLTLKETTQSVTFDAEVTVADEARLEGLAQATILYRDFNLVIPDVPGVSDVADEVILEIDFVATLVEE